MHSRLAFLFATACAALTRVPNTARRRRVVCRATDWTQSEDWALTDGAKRFTRSSRTGDERLFYEDLTASLGPAAGARDSVRDAVLINHRVLVPSVDSSCILAPRPRVRCSIVSLVAGAGVAALRAHCQCCPFYGSQGCPSQACAAGFVKEGSCARVLVISLPLVPCLPPQVALAMTQSSCLRTLNRSNFCHRSDSPRGRLRGPRDGAGAVLQFKFEKNRPSFVRT